MFSILIYWPNLRLTMQLQNRDSHGANDSIRILQHHISAYGLDGDLGSGTRNEITHNHSHQCLKLPATLPNSQGASTV
ncbi:pyk10-binding protein 1 [Moniliophthora roreri]|nr:pyk10-binding protein 1 [Moniliophthora roreri]